MMKYTDLPSDEIPEEVVEGISAILHKFSSSIIRIDSSGAATLVGSGTFVSLGTCRGILTAHHVVNELRLGTSLGLTMIEAEHAPQVPLQHVQILEVAYPLDLAYGENGPDLALIIIPDEHYETIKPYRSFYPIDESAGSPQKDYEDRLRRDPWFVCGAIGERTTQEPPSGGFDTVWGYHILAGMTFPEGSIEIDGYQYIDVVAEFSKGTPRSFGGMSGGGLWRVPLRVDEKEHISVKDYELSGVVFYQSELREGRRLLRCHGPNGISMTRDEWTKER